MIALFMLGISGVGFAEEDYYIMDFDVSTRTHDGVNPITYVWFEINDKNDFGFPVVDYIVESATITDPNQFKFSFTPGDIELNRKAFKEFRGQDYNKNGEMNLK